jgi:molecular chaperone DnaK (HSP70)
VDGPHCSTRYQIFPIQRYKKFSFNFQKEYEISFTQIFADDDKKIKEKVEAKNELESYAYSLKNQLIDKEKLGGKITDDDKTTIETAVEEAIKW